MFPPESGCPRTVGCVRFEATIDVAAPAQFLFEVYTDVERWPEWTASVTSVERLDQGMARGPGIITTGSHVVTAPAGGGPVKVTASLEQAGCSVRCSVS